MATKSHQIGKYLPLFGKQFWACDISFILKDPQSQSRECDPDPAAVPQLQSKRKHRYQTPDGQITVFNCSTMSFPTSIYSWVFIGVYEIVCNGLRATSPYAHTHTHTHCSRQGSFQQGLFSSRKQPCFSTKWASTHPPHIWTPPPRMRRRLWKNYKRGGGFRKTWLKEEQEERKSDIENRIT